MNASRRQIKDSKLSAAPSRGHRAGFVAAVAALALLQACGTPLPPPQLYQLRSAPPAGAAVMSAPAVAAGTPVLQLLLPVTLPEVLDRDAIIVPRGQAGVQALSGHRWAEPLRDAVPRLLQQDLSTLLGVGQVWSAPLPAGLAVRQTLRVQVLALQSNATRSAVELQAQWSIQDPAGRAAPLVRMASLQASVLGADVDGLVAAHRAVLWQLAQTLAQAVRSTAP